MTRRVWAPALVAGVYLVAAVIASVINNPAHPRVLAPVPLAILAGLLGALTLGPLAERLRLPLASRLTVLAVLVYALGTLSNEVEAMLFIKDSGLRGFITGAVLALALAVPIALLWPPADTEVTVSGALHATLASRRWWSWMWRIPVTAVLWVPVYLVFAAADAPFVHIYYARSGTPFTVPSNGVVVSGELLRGVLHVVVLGGLAALLVTARRSAWWWMAVSFAVINGWLPLIQRTDWPYFLRAANGVEITCDAVVYGALVALLLTRRGHPSPAGGSWAIIGDDAVRTESTTTSPARDS
jgi:hypothetical protein